MRPPTNGKADSLRACLRAPLASKRSALPPSPRTQHTLLPTKTHARRPPSNTTRSPGQSSRTSFLCMPLSPFAACTTLPAAAPELPASQLQPPPPPPQPRLPLCARWAPAAAAVRALVGRCAAPIAPRGCWPCWTAAEPVSAVSSPRLAAHPRPEGGCRPGPGNWAGAAPAGCARDGGGAGTPRACKQGRQPLHFLGRWWWWLGCRAGPAAPQLQPGLASTLAVVPPNLSSAVRRLLGQRRRREGKKP